VLLVQELGQRTRRTGNSFNHRSRSRFA
jgi:hypothetical protein